MAKGEAKATASLTTVAGAETWQFWAFVFGAFVTLAFSLVDEIPSTAWRLGLKAGGFVVIGGLVYRARQWLAGWPLSKLKTDSR